MSETVTETPAEAPEQPDTEPETPPDEADTDTPDEDEAEAEAEQTTPPPGISYEQLEQMRKKLDTSANTWRRRVEELLGEDFEMLTPCELCSFDIPGFHWPAELQQPISETHERLLNVLRQPAAPEYRDATQVRQCVDCAGWGKVKSGSRLASHETVTCPSCKGYGYTPPPVPTSSGNGYAEAVQIEGGGVGGDQDEPPADADIWGSPRILPDGQENPNYGKMPQYKNPTLP